MPKKILLADDSITIQKVVELTFSDGDYEVIATNNGTKAIETLDRVRPDIILSDIIMPEKNGYEVCEYVKSHPDLKHIPVILLTGTFEPFDPDRAEKAGCDAVVTKPFESQGLIQKVEQLIQHAAGSAAAAPTVEEPSPAPAPPAEPEPSPFDATSEPPAGSPFEDEPPPTSHDDEVFGGADEDSGETKLIPKMTFEDLQRMRDASQAPVSYPEPEPPQPEPEPATPPPMEMAEPPAMPEEPEDFGETKLIPKMTFEDLQRMEVAKAATSEPEPAPADESPFMSDESAAPEVADESPFESAPSEGDAFSDAEEESSPFGADSEAPAFETEPPAEAEAQLEAPFEPEPMEAEAEAPFEPEPVPAAEPDAPFESEPAPEAEAAASTEPEPSMEAGLEEPFEPEPVAAEPQPTLGSIAGGPLSDEDVDRIARRVIELMSEKVVREVAWEVTPEMAEMAVRERIRQLEAEEES